MKKVADIFGELDYQRWTQLLKQAIDLAGGQAAFCRLVHQNSERTYQEIYGKPSEPTFGESSWLSTSTLSRWINAKRCSVDAETLALIAITGLIKDECGKPLTFSEMFAMINLPKDLNDSVRRSS
jgi:hypothetical protein